MYLPLWLIVIARALPVQFLRHPPFKPGPRGRTSDFEAFPEDLATEARFRAGPF
jgi:hypothetical protein